MTRFLILIICSLGLRADIIDHVGDRSDKNSVGHGKNVAVYTGHPSRFFFATHEMGNIFSIVDGTTWKWFPDHVQLMSTNINGVLEKRSVCVTRRDVVVCEIELSNPGPRKHAHVLEFSGDSRNSFDWREKPLPGKTTELEGEIVYLKDPTVYPAALTNGLWMAIGAANGKIEVRSGTPGAYNYSVTVPLRPRQNKKVVVACTFGRSKQEAQQALRSVLRERSPIKRNREDWSRFFESEVPQFSSSDPRLDELYAFRWFLLRFSTAGGDLGYFEYPVVMEGRQAYQTYCCYSAPFMGFDLNWMRDPNVGFGHIANMAFAAYDDGRFPWYTSPRTNRVKVHHESASGLSLLPHTAWRHYLVHGRKDLLQQLYPSMKKNMEWWMSDRDSNKDGIHQIAHQYETGMDDLHRWGAQSMAWKYDAVDATSYAYINFRAVESMARVLGKGDEARAFATQAEKAARALNSVLYSAQSKSWRDRHPQTGELADVLAITTFYPFFADAAGPEHLPVLTGHLLNTNQFWLPFPVPALAADQKDFDPNGFWQGPSWPAATTHVIEGFARAAKDLDRALLPKAAELFRRSAYNHLQPRADFYERYNPLTGKALSKFRDYMHSWWIDLYIQHVAGLELMEDDSIQIDPLPLGLTHFALRGVPFRGKTLEVTWRNPNASRKLVLPAGLTVRMNGREILRAPDFRPGDPRLRVPLSSQGK